MSATGDFGPAPPGVDLSENQTNLLGSVIPLMILGTGAVALRVAARLKTKEVAFAIDDYLIFCALVFSYGTAIACFVSVPYGGGRHLQALTKHEFTVVWKILFAYVMIYATAVTCTKASIVMLYRRVFNLRFSIYLAMFFVLGYWVTIIVTILVACRPIPYFWKEFTDPEAVGVCIDVNKFFYGNGIVAMLIDVIILCVPMPTIFGLQMPLSQKFAVMGILLLGGFVCIASVVRIITLDHINHSDDPTWSMAPVFVWSCVEPFTGIVCACLPTFAPFFRRWWSSVRSGKSNSGQNNGYSASIKMESGSRFKSKRESKRDWAVTTVNADYDNFGPHGDEVQLTNEISGPGTSMHTKESDEEMGADAMNGITVREDVDVTWSHPHHEQ